MLKFDYWQEILIVAVFNITGSHHLFWGRGLPNSQIE
jgi:hypothetical protein